MQLLDGKKTSEDIKKEIAIEVQQMKDNGEKVPHLAAVIVGTDGASLTYVGSKVRSCQQIGFESTLVSLPESITEAELLLKIKELNEDDKIIIEILEKNGGEMSLAEVKTQSQFSGKKWDKTSKNLTKFNLVKVEKIEDSLVMKLI